jgi:taurine dioxygenase
MTMTRLTVEPLSSALGAVVEGVALRAFDDAAFAEVSRALLEHQVLFFRNQHLSESEQLAFASRFGSPMAHPVGRLAGDDRVIATIEDTADSPPTGDQWHTDITYWPEPPKFGVLCALDVPAVGGDTLWASLYAAFDALSTPLQQLCSGLRALHAPSRHFVQTWAQRNGAREGDLIEKSLAGAILPLVRTHDETGRQALFRTSGMQILDIHPAESDMLLDHFHELVNDPNRYVRWHWAEGDVAIWDERCTNHRALSDHYPRYRRMRRCTVEGNRPFYRASPDHDALILATAATP